MRGLLLLVVPHGCCCGVHATCASLRRQAPQCLISTLQLVHNSTGTAHKRHLAQGSEADTLCLRAPPPLQNRHLLRWWVHSDNNTRPVAPHYAPRSNVGPEGGFLVPDYPDLSKQHLPLYPYSRHDGLGQSAVE